MTEKAAYQPIYSYNPELSPQKLASLFVKESVAYHDNDFEGLVVVEEELHQAGVCLLERLPEQCEVCGARGCPGHDGPLQSAKAAEELTKMWNDGPAAKRSSKCPGLDHYDNL